MSDRFGGEIVGGATDRFGGAPVAGPKTGAEQVSQGVSGTYEGLAEVLGLPVDIVSAGLTAIGVGDDPDRIGGSESFKKLFSAVGGLTPAQPGYEMERRVGKEIGAAIPFAGAAGAVARGVNIVAKPTTSTMRGVGRAIIEPAVQAPAKTAIGELAAATGAGVGAGIAQQIAPGSVGAEVTGQLLGGIAPTAVAAGPTGMLVRAGKTALRKVSPKGAEESAHAALQDYMGQELTSGVAEKMGAGQAAAEAVPGLKPSIGEMSGSPALLAMQRTQESGLSGTKLERAVARQDSNVKAINDFAESVAPTGGVDVDVVIDSSKGKVNSLIEDITTRGTVEPVDMPGANTRNIGAKMRESLIERRREASAAMGEIADEMGLNQVDITPQYETVREDLINVMTPAGRFATKEHTPQIVDVLIGDRGVTAATSLDDLKGLREALSDEYRSAVTGAAPDLQRARYLKMGLNELDKSMDNLVFPDELASLYPEWRKAYFENVIDKFDRGAAFAVRKKGQKGFYVTDDERVAGSFFGTKKSDAMAQYVRIFGDSPEGMADMRAVIMDDFKNAVVRDGEIKPNLMNNWLRRYDKTLSEIPQVRDELLDVAGAQNAMRDRMQTLDLRQRKIEDAVLTRSLRAYSKGTQTAEQVVSNALAKPRLMRQLVNSVRGDEKALTALRRHVWDDVVAADSATMRKNMDDHMDSLKMVLTPAHLKNIDTIMDARMMVERSPTPTGRGGPEGGLAAAESQLGMGSSQLGSRIFAIKSGRIGLNYMLTDIFGRFFKRQSALAVERMLDEALFDPEVARLLVDGIKKPNSQPVRNRMKKYLFNLGIESREEE